MIIIKRKKKTMTENQITALAREYAEFTDTSDVEKKHISAICENFLKYTLRRFCLVEKNKVEEMYLNAKIAIVKGYDENLGGMMAVGSASKSILESLFPDLGKEVEG